MSDDNLGSKRRFLVVSWQPAASAFYRRVMDECGEPELYVLAEYFPERRKEGIFVRAKRFIFIALISLLWVHARLRPPSISAGGFATRGLRVLLIKRIERELFRMKKRFRHDLEENKPSDVIFLEDWVNTGVAELVKICKSEGIPTHAVPYTSRIREELIGNSLARTSIAEKATSIASLMLWPQFSGNSKWGMASLPLQACHQAEKFRLDKELIWSGLSGTVDHYYFYSEADFEEANKALDAKNVVQLIEPPGSTSVRLGLERARSSGFKAMCVVLPPNQFGGREARSRYFQLLSLIVDCVFSADLTVRPIVVPHPRSADDIRLWLADNDSYFSQQVKLYDRFEHAAKNSSHYLTFGSGLNEVIEFVGAPLVSSNIYNIKGFDFVATSATTISCGHEPEQIIASIQKVLLLDGIEVEPKSARAFHVAITAS